VDMNCSAFIPAGIDGSELDAAIRIRHLIAAQKLFPDRPKTWIRQ
jgi:hypothetical protein